MVRSISSRVSVIILGRVIVPTFVLSSTTPPAWTAMIIHTSVCLCWTALSLSLSVITGVWFSLTGRRLWPARGPDRERADIYSFTLSQDLELCPVSQRVKDLTVLAVLLEFWYFNHVGSICVLVGRREESGYTEGTSLQPNTFLPHHINMDDARRTQQSVTRTDFLPASFLQGSEALPKLAFCAPRDTGFTRDTQKPLTSSVSFQGNSSEASRQKDRSPAVRWSIGPMCSPGFILNAPNITSLSHTPASPQHFITHYQSKFCDRASVEQVRADWMKGGVQMHRQSGYSERDSSRDTHKPIYLSFTTT